MVSPQEPELTLKRISASALSDISKHSPELAQAVVDAGAVSLLSKDVSHVDAALKRQVRRRFSILLSCILEPQI